MATLKPKLRPTKLEEYLRSRGIKAVQLAEKSGYSRQHLLRIRLGEMEPGRPCIKAVTQACRDITGEDVKAADLFDLDD
jgi:predicted transcriptional regulator